MRLSTVPIKIEVLTYKPHKMAFVFISRKLVFSGNYWDFHADCHGTTIAGYDLSKTWARGVVPLATALQDAMAMLGKTAVISNRSLDLDEYESITK
jgi:hypothetical protein